MTNDVNHNEGPSPISSALQDLFPGSQIAWNRTREEVWLEMLEKIDSKDSDAGKNDIRHVHFIRYAAAALIAMLLGMSALMFFYTKTIRAPFNQNAELFLPDRSKVTVYAQSTLSYKPLLWKFSRTVQLEGEGYFEVSKGKTFEVVSTRGKTEVLGTQFDVFARDTSYIVICISGRVKVTENAHQHHVVITKDQKAILKGNGNFKIIEHLNIQPETSLKETNSILDNELNTIILTTPTALKSDSRDQAVHSEVNMPVPKTKATGKEPEKVKEQNDRNEEAESHIRNLGSLPNKGNPEDATKKPAENRNKEQETNRQQQDQTDQNTGNKQIRDRFRASLTPEQISILEDPKMSREEKRKAFLESLAPWQQKLLDEQKKTRTGQAGTEKKEPTVSGQSTNNPKMTSQDQMRDQAGKGKPGQHPQQSHINKESIKPGTGSGPGAGSENRQGSGKGN